MHAERERGVSYEKDREILQPLLARVGDQASVVAELVLGPQLKQEKPS